MLVLVVVVVVVLLAGSGTAVLQTVFALAMQVFVVRIHRTACALVAVKVLIWLFAFRLDAGTDLFGGFLLFPDAGMGMELVAQSQVARLCC